MKTERIMSYSMAHKINEKDLQEVSAAGNSQATLLSTHNPNTVGNVDIALDV